MLCTYKEKFHFTNSFFEISTNTFMTKVYLLVSPTHHTQLSIVLSNHLAPTHFENNLMKLKLNNSQKVNVSPTIDLARLCTGMEDRNENGKRPQKIQFHFLGESSSAGNEVISAFNFNTTHPPSYLFLHLQLLLKLNRYFPEPLLHFVRQSCCWQSA